MAKPTPRNRTIPPTTNPKNIFLSFIHGAEIAPTPKTIKMATTHQGINSPMGTLPNIKIIPDTNSKVASKFLIRNALYDADATKNASNANIVEESGVKILKNIHENRDPFACKWTPHFFDFISIFTSNLSSFSMNASAPDCVMNILGISYPSSASLILLMTVF